MAGRGGPTMHDVAQVAGVSVMTVPGDGLAFKITEPMDLVLAEVIARGEA